MISNVTLSNDSDAHWTNLNLVQESIIRYVLRMNVFFNTYKASKKKDNTIEAMRVMRAKWSITLAVFDDNEAYIYATQALL